MPDAAPTVSIDYGFMGEDDGKCMPILTMKPSQSKDSCCVLVSWLPRPAAFVLSKYRKGKDGRTSAERAT